MRKAIFIRRPLVPTDYIRQFLWHRHVYGCQSSSLRPFDYKTLYTTQNFEMDLQRLYYLVVDHSGLRVATRCACDEERQCGGKLLGPFGCKGSEYKDGEKRERVEEVFSLYAVDQE